MSFKVESSADGKLQVHTQHGYAVTVDLNWSDFSEMVNKAIAAKELEARNSKQRWTTSGDVPEDWEGPAPAPINPATGQHKDYWILPPEERAKGFIRPVRKSYLHVGIRPKYSTRELTSEEKEQYSQYGYVLFEEYPEDRQIGLGRFWTEAQLKSGCGALTTMSSSIAETYARNPGYYGATFCVNCKNHFPVGEYGEFVWEDGSRVGT